MSETIEFTKDEIQAAKRAFDRVSKRDYQSEAERRAAAYMCVFLAAVVDQDPDETEWLINEGNAAFFWGVTTTASLSTATSNFKTSFPSCLKQMSKSKQESFLKQIRYALKQDEGAVSHINAVFSKGGLDQHFTP